MTAIDVHIVRAFTHKGTGGNPAGIVLDADGLSKDKKQAIAGQVGLSETAFVSKSETETIRLEFFTPTRQIAHCGHATIATFGYLKHLGRIGDGLHSKETIDGVRFVRVSDSQIAMQQNAPRYDTLSQPDVLESLHLPATAVLAPYAPVIVNTGNSFAVVGVREETILRALQPDMTEIARISDRHDLIGFYVFAFTSGFDATTRMFAPRYGIDEEAATGMAAGPLACLLHRHGAVSPLKIEQGRHMQPASPSALQVDLETDASGTITSLWASGTAHLERVTSIDL